MRIRRSETLRSVSESSTELTERNFGISEFNADFTVKSPPSPSGLSILTMGKSNNEKKAANAAAGKAPKMTKQQENAGKSATQKKAEQQAKKAAKRDAK